MNSLTFTVPGDPRGKGRPRATRFGKGIRLYTDEQTASYENLVALAAREAMKGAAPFDVALRIDVVVVVKVPASVSAKKREAMLVNDILPAKKPDLDNVCKAVLDGLNTVAFTDDALVVELHASKFYGATPCVSVAIRPA